MSKELNNSMNEMLAVLDAEGYPFKAGYLDTLLRSLMYDLNLTADQKQLLTENFDRRVRMYREYRQRAEDLNQEVGVE